MHEALKTELAPSFVGNEKSRANVSASAAAASGLSLLIPRCDKLKTERNRHCLAGQFSDLANFPVLIADSLAIHVPPTASTRSLERYCPRLDGSTPPVGMNCTLPYGAAIAFRKSRPPEAPAGKNFRTSRPRSRAISISDGELIPGVTGIS